MSCTQAEALVLAAEARTRLRPRRRTELLGQRMQAFEQQIAHTDKRWETQQQAVKRAKERLAEAEQQVDELYASTLNLRNDHLGMPLSFGSEVEQAKLIPQLFTGSI